MNTPNTPLSVEELNIFKNLYNKNPKKSIIIRIVVFGITLCILSFIANLNAPFLNTLNSSNQQELKNILGDESINKLFIIVQSFSALFSPLLYISINVLGIKLLVAILGRFKNKNITLLQAFFLTTLSYSFLYIEQVFRFLFSIFKQEYMQFTFGSLNFWLHNTSPWFNIDIFSIIYIASLSIGIQTFSKISFKIVFPIILIIYITLTILV